MLCACCKADDVPVEEVNARPLTSESGVVFTFKLPDGTRRQVHFQQKPLGLDFAKSIPMMVKAVKKDSAAEDADIQPNWTVTHVKGQELPMNIREATNCILEAVKDLPPS